MNKNCPKHGDYEAIQTEVLGSIIESSCPGCFAEFEASEAEEKNKNEEAQAIERAKAMNLRPAYYHASFDNLMIIIKA